MSVKEVVYQNSLDISLYSYLEYQQPLAVSLHASGYYYFKTWLIPTPRSFSSVTMPNLQLHILESYCRFDEPKYITLHFATLNDICKSSDHLMRLLMSSCNCEHSDWLRTLPETLVPSANLRMEFLMLLCTKRFGNL